MNTPNHIKLVRKQATQCNLLCSLRFAYPKQMFVEYTPDSRGPKFQVSVDNTDAHHLSFQKVYYRLSRIYIVPPQHTVTDTNTRSGEHVGECVLVHENIADASQKLYVIVLLTTDSGEISQSSTSKHFFNALVPSIESSGTQTLQLPTSWSPLQALPYKKSFFMYTTETVYEKHTLSNVSPIIVFEKPVGILKKTFDTLKSVHSLNLKQINVSYYNNGSTVTGATFKQKHGIQVQCKKRIRKKKSNDTAASFQDSDSDDDTPEIKKAEDDDENDENDDTRLEKRLLVFIASLLGICALTGFFMGSTIAPDMFRIPLKCIGLLVWIPVHFAYIYIGRGISVCLLGIMYGMFLFIDAIRAMFKNTTLSESTSSSLLAMMKHGHFDNSMSKKASLLFICATCIVLLVFALKYFGVGVRSKPPKVLCKNTIRKMSIGVPIDVCKRPAKLDAFISDPTERTQFMKRFQIETSIGHTPKVSAELALKSLDPNFSFSRNFKKPLVVSGYPVGTKNYKFCNLWNTTFAESGTERDCNPQKALRKKKKSTGSCNVQEYAESLVNMQNDNGFQTNGLRKITHYAEDGTWIDLILIDTYAKHTTKQDFHEYLERHVPLFPNVDEVSDLETVDAPRVRLEVMTDETNFGIEGLLFIHSNTLAFVPRIYKSPFVTVEGKKFTLYKQFKPNFHYQFTKDRGTSDDVLALSSSPFMYLPRQNVEWSAFETDWRLGANTHIGSIEYTHHLKGDQIINETTLLNSRQRPPRVTFTIEHVDKTVSGWIFQKNNSVDTKIYFKFDEQSKCLRNAVVNRKARILQIEPYDTSANEGGFPFRAGLTFAIGGLDVQVIEFSKTPNNIDEQNAGMWNKNGPFQQLLQSYYTKTKRTTIPLFENRLDGPIVKFKQNIHDEKQVYGYLFQQNGKVLLTLTNEDVEPFPNNTGLIMDTVFGNLFKVNSDFQVGVLGHDGEYHWKKTEWIEMFNRKEGGAYIYLSNTTNNTFFNYVNMTNGPVVELYDETQTLYKGYLYVKDNNQNLQNVYIETI